MTLASHTVARQQRIHARLRFTPNRIDRADAEQFILRPVIHVVQQRMPLPQPRLVVPRNPLCARLRVNAPPAELRQPRQRFRRAVRALQGVPRGFLRTPQRGGVEVPHVEFRQPKRQQLRLPTPFQGQRIVLVVWFSMADKHQFHRFAPHTISK